MVNGTFTWTAEKLNGRPVYVKFVGLVDSDLCVYFGTNGRWWVATSAHKEANACRGFAHTEEGLPSPALAKTWHVVVGGVMVPQPVEATHMVKHYDFYLFTINSS